MTFRENWIRHLLITTHRIPAPACPAAWLLGLTVCLPSPFLQAQSPSTGKTYSFSLDYVEKGSSLSVSPGKEDVKFRKEPDFGKDKVLRRALVIEPGKNEFIGYAVDVTRRTLYLDLNQNLDLTDDPKGVYKGEGTSRYAYFKDIPLILRKDGVQRNYTLFVNLSGGEIGSISVISFYYGEIQLPDQKWVLMVSDNLDGEINSEDEFSVSPFVSGVQPEKRAVSSYRMSVPEHLFLGGRYYEVKFAYGPPKTNFSTVTADFTEIKPALGELILDGQFVRKLVLEGDAGSAILDAPSHSVLVPVDKYQVQDVQLEPAAGMGSLSADVSEIRELSISPTTPCHLKVGGPLESSVAVKAYGNVLRLDYILKGAGGERYSVVNTNSKNAPRFSIYKGDRQLATGSFQFG